MFFDPENLAKAKQVVVEKMKEVLERPGEQGEAQVEQVEEQPTLEVPTPGTSNILHSITKRIKLNSKKKVGP